MGRIKLAIRAGLVDQRRQHDLQVIQHALLIQTRQVHQLLDRRLAHHTQQILLANFLILVPLIGSPDAPHVITYRRDGASMMIERSGGWDGQAGGYRNFTGQIDELAAKYDFTGRQPLTIPEALVAGEAGEEWWRYLTAPFALARSVMPRMRAGGGGLIVTRAGETWFQSGIRGQACSGEGQRVLVRVGRRQADR